MSAPAWTADVVTALSDSHPRLGRVVRTGAGDEFMFVKGVTSNAAGKWVSFNYSTYTSVLLAADAVGFVGISMGAATGSQWGWIQIRGLNTIASSDTTASGVALYIDGTAGRVDDATVSGDLVFGAFSNGADATNVLSVSIDHPFVTNILG